MKILLIATTLLLALLYGVAGAQTCVQADLTHPLQATLTWVDNSTDETGFILERSLNGGTFAGLAPIGPNTTQVIDTTVVRAATPNTYTYRLKAIKAISGQPALESAYTATACITFAALPPAPPSAPSGFTVSQNTLSPTDTLSMTWDDTPNESSYEVVGRKAVGNRAFIKLATLPADQTNYDWTGLSPHTSYCGRVRAVNARGGASGYSSLSCATTSR